MYCAACNLNYPDHLKYCRRCGQPLLRAASEPLMDSICCTRCGARTVRGENFCQQCGNRIGASAPETVVGACYHCGTSWRSGWLFCKTCGLDRDRALLLPTSWPAAPSSSQNTLITEVEGLAQFEKVFCKRCGAEAKPFSRFCEACGNTLGLSEETSEREAAEVDQVAEDKLIEDAPITGKLVEPPVKKLFASDEGSPAAPRQSFSYDRVARPTVFEPSSDTSRSGRSTIAIGEASMTTDYADEPEPVVINEAEESGSETVITSLPKTGPISADDVKDSSRLVQKSDSAGALIVWIIIITLTVAAGIIAWRLLRSHKQPLSSGAGQEIEQATPVAAVSPDVVPSPGASPAVSVIAPEGMVYVPGGSFMMGRDEGDEYESPAHPVSVRPFFIDRTEVTNEDYQRFVSATGYRAPVHWVDGKISEGQAKYPVVNVSWDDANAYAQWANKRLPTEIEWEFAARGTDGRLYPWGSGWKPEHANAGRPGLVEVGSYALGASPFGALDMTGNAWEWTASDYEDYPGRKTPTSLAGTGLKVIRGGAYDVPPKRATATYRGAIPPDRIPDKTGFRCARDAQ